MRGYYCRWLWIAFRHSFGVADTLAGAIGLFAPPILRLLNIRNFDRIVSELNWQIPLGAMSAIFVARLILAPYWMHQENEAKRQAGRVEEERKRAELEAKLEAEQVQQKALLGDRSKRQEQIDCLARLLEEAERLKQEQVTHKDHFIVWIRAYEEWIQSISVDLGQNFSPAEAKILLSLSPVIDRSRGYIDNIHQNAFSRISAIQAAIHDMHRSLRERS